MPHSTERVVQPPFRSRVAQAAALGLLLAACDKTPSPSEARGEPSATPGRVVASAAATPSADKNCCMGKNECKGQGGCAVPESNSCAGKNECKGKGGCNMHCPK